MPALVRTAGELPEKDRAAVGLPRKLIVIVQRPDRGRREWQVVRPLDQAQTRRHLVEQKSVADPPARRGVKDDVPRSPPLQSIELDHIVEGRHVADVARPDLIEHAIGQTRHPERLRLRKVALIGAGKQRSRVAHAAEPLVEANGAEKIFFGRARSGMQDTLHPVPRLLRPVMPQQHEISDGEPERLASFPTRPVDRQDRQQQRQQTRKVRGQEQRGNQKARGPAHIVSDLVEQNSGGWADGVRHRPCPRSA